MDIKYNYKEIAREMLMRGFVADEYDHWVRLGMSLSELGDEGKDLFHLLSSSSHKYKMAETEKKFARCTQHTNRKIGIGTFLLMAKNTGVDIKEFRINNNLNYKKMNNNSPLFDTIPTAQMQKTISDRSSFCQFLQSIYTQEQVAAAVNLYKLGLTRNGDTIFWQIDRGNRVRTGKIMKYDPLTGHRLHEEGAVGWIHNCNGIKKNFNLEQCLFGLHLTAAPDASQKLHCVVESEKTAVICAMEFPQNVWLATGGVGNLTEDKLLPIKDRNISLFADADAFGAWNEKTVLMRNNGFNIMLSDEIENKATADEKAAKLDLADFILREKGHWQQTIKEQEPSLFAPSPDQFSIGPD
ncbi:MAG: DUF6371 domain-containing protein [Bacteroidaceae bacterium]|nr:DUF6371 domain-containing protein [Bacteroidaceae bacterium]